MSAFITFVNATRQTTPTPSSSEIKIIARHSITRWGDVHTANVSLILQLMLIWLLNSFSLSLTLSVCLATTENQFYIEVSVAYMCWYEANITSYVGNRQKIRNPWTSTWNRLRFLLNSFHHYCFVVANIRQLSQLENQNRTNDLSEDGTKRATILAVTVCIFSQIESSSLHKNAKQMNRTINNHWEPTSWLDQIHLNLFIVLMLLLQTFWFAFKSFRTFVLFFCFFFCCRGTGVGVFIVYYYTIMIS